MKQREILLIVGSFFGLVLLYFGFSLYHNYVTSTIPENLNVQITPISPTFDSKTIEDLKKRNKVSPVFQASPVQNQTQTQEIATQSATSSAE